MERIELEIKLDDAIAGLMSRALDADGCDRCGEPRDTRDVLCSRCLSELEEVDDEEDWEGDTLANLGLSEADFR